MLPNFRKGKFGVIKEEREPDVLSLVPLKNFALPSELSTVSKTRDRMLR